MSSLRDRADRCPGVLRPWIADDGALVRLRLVGGELTTAALRSLIRIAADHGDGDLHLTRRANLQLRAIAHTDGCVPERFVDEVTAAGLLPHAPHELVRNIMTSPLTGRAGGRADLRPVARRLDEMVCADPALAALAGRFLFVLDDGRGDVAGRSLDLGLVAVGATQGQIRVGTDLWGPVMPLTDAAEILAGLARSFLAARGTGEEAAWHIDELPVDRRRHLVSIEDRDGRTRVTSPPPAYGTIAQDDGRSAEHVPVPDGLLSPALAAEVLARAGDTVIVTPWRSLLIPDLEVDR